MSVVIGCPRCRGSIAVQKSQAGRVLRCPFCHGSVTVPHPPPARHPAPREEPGEYELRVSARVLHFPGRCCCCGRANNPDRKYSAESTRVTGVRVVRHDTRGWSFPLCAGCEDWIRAVRKIPPPYTGTVLWGFTALALAGLAGAVLAAVDEIGRGEFPLTGFGLGLPASAFAALFYWLNSTLRIKHNRQRRRRQAAAGAIRPAPVCHTRPVKYLGWHGSVHTFVFSNPDFYQVFASTNGKKVIR